MGVEASRSFRDSFLRSLVLTVIVGIGVALTHEVMELCFMLLFLVNFLMLVYRFTMWRILAASPGAKARDVADEGFVGG